MATAHAAHPAGAHGAPAHPPTPARAAHPTRHPPTPAHTRRLGRAVGKVFGAIGRLFGRFPKLVSFGVAPVTLVALNIWEPAVWAVVAVVLLIVYRQRFGTWAIHRKMEVLTAIAAILLLVNPTWNGTWWVLAAVVASWWWILWGHGHKLLAVASVVLFTIWLFPQGTIGRMEDVRFIGTPASWVVDGLTAAHTRVDPLFDRGFDVAKHGADQASSLAKRGAHSTITGIGSVIGWIWGHRLWK